MNEPIRRSGTRIIYAGQPGEMIALIPRSKCAVVAHPDRPVKLVYFDGSEEQFVAVSVPVA